MLNAPVAFIIFRRPEVTARVFEEIRQAQPKKLLVIVDGARLDKPGEAEKCAATRAIIDRYPAILHSYNPFSTARYV